MANSFFLTDSITLLHLKSQSALHFCRFDVKHISASGRCAIITEKVNICVTLLGPLLPPYFLLSKAKASCSLTPPPSKVGKACTLSGARVLRLHLIILRKNLSEPSYVGYP